MILLLDGGNTRLKWGLRQQGQWRGRGALERERIGDLPQVMRQALLPGETLRRILFCNVAGPEVAAAVAQALAPLSPGLEVFAAGPTVAGVRNGYARPGQLGADRWAALVGAWHLERRPCLVVNAGTALTVDVLLQDPEMPGGGYFAGGCILPGFELMRRALNRHTAQLPLAEADFAELPRDTDAAIVSGCLHAQAGAVERLYRQLPPGSPCLLSGGGAPQLDACLDPALPVRQVEFLVLEGLARVADLPAPAGA